MAGVQQGKKAWLRKVRFNEPTLRLLLWSMEAKSQPFPFGQKGIIISGEHPGWSIEIIDDTAGETGGYFIYIIDPDPESKDFMGFDWWFEHAAHIPRFIEDMNWQIDWNRASLIDI